MLTAVREARTATAALDPAHVRRIGAAAGDTSGHGAWASVLAAGGAAVLPGRDHAGWLPESVELWWRAPLVGDSPVRVDVTMRRGHGGRAVVRTTATRGDAVVADVILHA